jgi:hypothetical protein
MKEIMFKSGRCISLGSMENENDLKPIPGKLNINPPPSDGKCMCCGKHISKLKPFGKAGDPLVGDFEGALLVKTFRPDGPYNEEAELAMNEAEQCYEGDGYKDILDWMINKYGKEKGERFYWQAQLHGSVGKSWLCKNCIVLDIDEYFERLREEGANKM